MADVEFEDRNFAGGRFEPQATTTPVLVKFLMKTRVVQNESQANYVLIGLSVCAFVLAIVIFWNALQPPTTNLNQNVRIPSSAVRGISR